MVDVCDRWNASEAGECSAVCGPGAAKRIVTCVRYEGGHDVEVDHSLCSGLFKPPVLVSCVIDVCPIGWESKGQVLQRSIIHLINVHTEF